MFRSLIEVIRECCKNSHRLITVSAYNLAFQYNQTKLKLLWTIINPVLQSLTYYLAFHIGMRNNSPIEGVSYLCWMLTGVIPWFYISIVMMGGVNSIVASSGILKNMKYPVSIIPVSTVCTEFIAHLCYMIVLIVIQLLSGVVFGLGILYIFYFFICEFFLLLGYTFLMSSLNVFIRDLQRMVGPAVRLLFFLTPICWSEKGTVMEDAQRWNPIAYLIEGFRGSMLHNGEFSFENWQHGYFWGITIFLLLIGCWIHRKLKPTFVDYL